MSSIANDLITKAEEDRINRHDPVRAGTSLGTLLKRAGNVLAFNLTTGASSIKIFNQNAPYKFQIVDVIIQPRGDSTNGTMKITDGTNDITDAMVVAADKTMVRAASIDDLYSTIEKGQTLEVVCAGDTAANTIGLVTIIIVPVEE